MNKKALRHRIDYMPGRAALAVIQEAAQRHPALKTQQSIIDMLVIVGWSALTHQHWTPPPLCGTNRERWIVAGVPGKEPTS